jgi:hydroxyethylthiazole kinase
MTPPSLAEAAAADLEAVRRRAPLVHNITNFVVMNLTANVLLALGAAPVMAHAPEEVEEMVGLAQALVLNIGTLSAEWVGSMETAARTARGRALPIVLDPVGAGATRYRTESCRRLMAAAPPTIVRGNASEILALDGAAGAAGATRGVDSTAGSHDARDAAGRLARRLGGAVCVSGPVDFILGHGAGDGFRVLNGDPWMARVTGLGCSATAVVAAFAAVNSDPVLAATHGMAILGIAGELARERAAGPGSFAVALLDALAGLDRPVILERARIARGDG